MKKVTSDFQTELGSIQNGDALDQSIALNKIVMALLDQSKKQNRSLVILLAISIVINLFIVGIFVWYESGFDTTVTTTTTTITQDSMDGTGNNVYQSGNSAKYIQGNMTEEDINGETEDCDYSYNKNQD